jgi:hypothetical protein
MVNAQQCCVSLVMLTTGRFRPVRQCITEALFPAAGAVGAGDL